jgi:hypothetical protein
LKKKGLCRDCAKPAVPGRVQCQVCLDKGAKRRRDLQKQHPAYWMYANSKRRAQEFNLPFTISLSDIELPEYCPVLGIKLEHGAGKIQDASPTLDRIVPELGYVCGNIIVMSRRANRLKNNATLSELMALGRWAANVGGLRS